MSKISEMFKLHFWRDLSLCEMLDLLDSSKDKEGTEEHVTIVHQFFTIIFFCRNKSFEQYVFFNFQGALSIFRLASEWALFGWPSETLLIRWANNF